MIKKKIHLVAGARPNFMKVGPLYQALKQENWCELFFVHTGQHYDLSLSEEQMKAMKLPSPDISLGIKGKSHAEQTGEILIAYEKVLLETKPDLVIVVGDVNSTLAAALAAVKLNMLVAHLEAGLRSRDKSMPEEINRLIVDSISDILWTPSLDANQNLINEGVNQFKVSLVGNIMIDAYCLARNQIEQIPSAFKAPYAVVTLHRHSNVDEKEMLEKIVKSLISISQKIPLVFPVHPRTLDRLKQFGLYETLLSQTSITLKTPMGYLEFMSLLKNSAMVISDSGGVQEETTYLKIPCLTLRENTERPITLTEGSNRLVSLETLEYEVERVLNNESTDSLVPNLWDGNTSQRIVANLRQIWGITC